MSFLFRKKSSGMWQQEMSLSTANPDPPDQLLVTGFQHKSRNPADVLLRERTKVETQLAAPCPGP